MLIGAMTTESQSFRTRANYNSRQALHGAPGAQAQAAVFPLQVQAAASRRQGGRFLLKGETAAARAVGPGPSVAFGTSTRVREAQAQSGQRRVGACR